VTLGTTSWTTDGATTPHWWAFEDTTNLDKTRTVSLDLTPPVATGRLYYLLTNTSSDGTDVASLEWATGRGLSAGSPPRGVSPSATQPHRVSLRDLVSAPVVPPPAGVRGVTATAVPESFAVGDATTFVDSLWDTSLDSVPSATNNHPSRLVSQTSVVRGTETHTLDIWVADDCWSTNGTSLALAEPSTAKGSSPTTAWDPPAHLVTKTMVDALANAFLQDGTNDIYGWVTSLVGE